MPPKIGRFVEKKSLLLLLSFLRFLRDGLNIYSRTKLVSSKAEMFFQPLTVKACAKFVLHCQVITQVNYIGHDPTRMDGKFINVNVNVLRVSKLNFRCRQVS